MTLDDLRDVAGPVGQAHRLGLVDVAAEQEHVDVAIVVEAAAQRQDAFGETLHQALTVQGAHRARDVEHQADPGAMRFQSDLGQRHARRFHQADQLGRLCFDALFEADARRRRAWRTWRAWRAWRAWRTGLRRRLGRRGFLRDVGAEMPHQRGQSAVEPLSDRHEAPPSVPAVELAEHDCLLLREVAAGEHEPGERAGRAVQSQVTVGQLRHGAAAIDAGGDDDPLDLRRQHREAEQETVHRTPLAPQRHAAAGRGGLVEEGHVAVVRQPAAGIDPETGDVQRQPLDGQVHPQLLLRNLRGKGHPRPPRQFLHMPCLLFAAWPRIVDGAADLGMITRQHAGGASDGLQEAHRGAQAQRRSGITGCAPPRRSWNASRCPA